ncbi:replication-relaxation family protein [Streptomyces sp. WAC 06783]|uniref:replication-relaxation family protein n=1 Tax=Streptomyces sp. WAC 06783 TaxID=2203211 RepID=UPI00289770EF|nr:replication-relaxation family protein [Streptomyces sp. WAC 06783]
MSRRRTRVRRRRLRPREGLVGVSGKSGRDRIWNLTPSGLEAVSEGNELPSGPRAGTGARGIRAGFGPHGIAVTETILACGGRRHLCGWQVGVNHAIKAIGLSFGSDVVLALPTATCEVRLFEVDNGTMARARLAEGVWG